MDFLPDCMNTTELSERGIVVPILRIDGDLRGEPLVNGDEPVTVTIAGPDSKRYRDAQRAVNARRIKTLSASQEFDEDRAEVELLAAIVLSWTGFHDGKASAPCTAENAATVFERFPLVRDQISNKFSSRRNFIKGSSPA